MPGGTATRWLAVCAALGAAAGCGRELIVPLDPDAIGIVLTSASPVAAVRDVGCFTVDGTGLSGATRARVGGSIALLELVDDNQVRVCPALSTPLGAVSLEVGDNVGFVALPVDVSVTSTGLTVDQAPSKVAEDGELTISGHGFDLGTFDNNVVTFLGDPMDPMDDLIATVVSSFDTEVRVAVPAGAVTGPVEITLGSVDPAVGVQPVGIVTLVGDFTIDALVSARGTMDAFARERITLTLSRPVQETSFVPLEITVEGEAAQIISFSGADLDFVVPPEVEAGLRSLEVTGDFSQSRNLNVLGPGHTDIQRAPNCRVDFVEDVTSGVSFSYPSQTHEATLDQDFVFFLDSERLAIHSHRIGVSGTTPIGIYPLPHDGVYSRLLTHIGCEFAGMCAMGFDLESGYAVVRDIPNNALVVVRLRTGAFARVLLLGQNAQFVNLMPIDRYRFATGIERAGGTEINIVDVRDLPPVDTMAGPGTPVGGSIIAVTPIDPPLQTGDETLWRTWLVALRTGMNTLAWRRLDFGPTPMMPAASPAPVMQPAMNPLASNPMFMAGAGTEIRLSALPGSNVAMLNSTMTGSTHLLRFAPGMAAMSGVRLVGESLCSGPCGGPTDESAFAVSTQTTFNASAGHWIMMRSAPDGMPPALYSAFVPPLNATFFMTAPNPLTLPLMDLTGPPPGSALVGAPLGDLWLPPEPSAMQELPRTALSFGGETTTVTTFTLPYAGDVMSAGPTFADIDIRDWAPARFNPGVLDAVVFGWDRRASTLRVLVPTVGSHESIPLGPMPAGRLDRLPPGNLFSLTGQHGLRGMLTNSDTLAQILVDDSGQQLGAMGVILDGAIVKDPTSNNVATALVDSDMMGTGTVTVTPFVPDPEVLRRSFAAGAVARDFTEPSCFDEATGTVAAPPQMKVLPDGRLAGSCFEELAAASCGDADPSDGIANTMTGCGQARTSRLYLWSPDYAGTGTAAAVDTGLCGQNARVVAVVPGSTPGTELMIWSTDVCGAAGSFQTHHANLITFDGTTFTDVTPGLAAPDTAVMLGSVLGDRAFYDARSDRWLYIKRAPLGEGDLIAIDELTLMTTKLMDITSNIADVAMSPDNKRFYVLSDNGHSVTVVRNALVPSVMGTTGLSARASTLAPSANGATLIAAVTGGYCVLSD